MDLPWGILGAVQRVRVWNPFLTPQLLFHTTGDKPQITFQIYSSVVMVVLTFPLPSAPSFHFNVTKSFLIAACDTCLGSHLNESVHLF